jgi:hypothetical protein
MSAGPDVRAPLLLKRLLRVAEILSRQPEVTVPADGAAEKRPQNRDPRQLGYRQRRDASGTA